MVILVGYIKMVINQLLLTLFYCLRAECIVQIQGLAFALKI